MTTIDIRSWLESISPSIQPPSTTRKRLALHAPSPPDSDEANMATTRSQGKRLREAAEPSESENRRQNAMSPVAFALNGQPSPAPSTYSQPSVKKRSIYNHENGYCLYSFADQEKKMPNALKEFVDSLRQSFSTSISKAEKILASSENDGEQQNLVSIELNQTASYPESHQPLYPHPSLIIKEAVEDTAKYLSKSYEEAAWNDHVHSLVLRQIFRRERPSDKPELSSYCYCPSSSIYERYVLRIPKNFKIDFYITLPIDEKERYDINEVCDTKQFSMGHMKSNLLNYQPTALPIKTKATMDDFSKGWHQLAIVLTAQWLWLHGPERITPNITFLLGILVVEDEWYLCALVPQEGEQNRLYNKLLLGSTDGTANMNELLLSLRHVRQWVEEVYRPGMKQHVFKIGS